MAKFSANLSLLHILPDTFLQLLLHILPWTLPPLTVTKNPKKKTEKKNIPSFYLKSFPEMVVTQLCVCLWKFLLIKQSNQLNIQSMKLGKRKGKIVSRNYRIVQEQLEIVLGIWNGTFHIIKKNQWTKTERTDNSIYPNLKSASKDRKIPPNKIESRKNSYTRKDAKLRSITKSLFDFSVLPHRWWSSVIKFLDQSIIVEDLSGRNGGDDGGQSKRNHRYSESELNREKPFWKWNLIRHSLKTVVLKN